ncbi:MAG: hypothetical protein JWM43_1479 [Acidobacteriaceae bacterium]|nr:hypothetical protein [Acidobacteriaceae bacterium]
MISEVLLVFTLKLESTGLLFQMELVRKKAAIENWERRRSFRWLG